ncbi:LysM peptidoglycan-binding domain-containing protein [Cumulibacter soli]|uniref:LysM peptidoglycan-binding domain-containing protein n=1 Tax=Cumulibacter soli TaxID=2546344 RepID=UPI0010684AA0|nr:LysM domain-containing protein [Cumulibacter soli]
MVRRIIILRSTGLIAAFGLLVPIAGVDLPGALAAVRDPQHVVDTSGADVLVLYLAQLALTALCGWCALCVALTAASALHPSRALRRASIRLTPRIGRSALAAMVGLSAIGLTACGSPSEAHSESPSTPPAYVASSEAFDWAIEPPTSEPASGAAEHSGAADAAEHTAAAAAGPGTADSAHTVAAEDCLWDIAEAQLPASASAGAVALLVEEIYAANQHVIGPNPDLLPIGAVLTIPAT